MHFLEFSARVPSNVTLGGRASCQEEEAELKESGWVGTREIAQ